MTWSSDAYLGKARRYIEFGLDAEDDAVRAWWFHFAVEPLVRAAVATLHPAVLADPQSVDSLLSSVGVGTVDGDESVSRSRAINQVLEIATRLDAFDPEVKAAASKLILRRNAECHGPAAVFEGLAEDAWMPDFLRVVAACCSAVDVDLATIVGEGYAAHAVEIAEEKRAEAEATVARLIAGSRKRPQADVIPPDWTMIERTTGDVHWLATCPACQHQGQMSGTRVHVGSPRFDGDELSRPVTIAGTRFSCARCGLELRGRAQLSAASLPATVRTSDWLDPYETLNLDPAEEAEARGLHIVDPEDFLYQDE